MVKLIRGLFRAGCSQMAKHRLPESGDGEALRHLQGQVFQSVGGYADGVIFFGGGVAGVGEVAAGLGAAVMKTVSLAYSPAWDWQRVRAWPVLELKATMAPSPTWAAAIQRGVARATSSVAAKSRGARPQASA